MKFADAVIQMEQGKHFIVEGTIFRIKNDQFETQSKEFSNRWYRHNISYEFMNSDWEELPDATSLVVVKYLWNFIKSSTKHLSQDEAKNFMDTWGYTKMQRIEESGEEFVEVRYPDRDISPKWETKEPEES